jgi:mono/diheme cytochrome c family protein
MLRTTAIALALLGAATAALASEPATPGTDFGKTVSIIGGCNDCHTADYNIKGGVINPDTALKGNPVGYQGPWGTTYAVNLRLLAGTMKEDDWVKYLKTFTARPPMPFYNVQALDDVQMRSLYEYIVSLGAPGDPAPAYVPPGQKPKFPYVVFAPPVMP